eukprot:CAMPEP_0198725148 /NCGR_PEP_ID=MMETSP1475-20131203/2508_1 /TAXON_ID= ORGANISM="Unidentified sp., Strain CCMP1999" /NCGR_SAMPLE_ID=MMETSP1475 /ASSEMBLY_ACC=CAM_ASM_001111 /LENGTH=675 /DNA_ID=CAMNT_0044486861 /DNA_START=211 /DNA_END=2238 /DNA_ORIENTATION=-
MTVSSPQRTTGSPQRSVSSPQPARRPNALLRGYYRTSPRPKGDARGEEEEIPDGGKAAAHKYAAELIQTLPLSRLLVCSTQLRKEAREVEAGLHRIVQESYAKFQATAGVVEEISDKTTSMGGELTSLLGTVQTVGEQTDNVNARLAEGREKVEQLEGARRVLQLLRVARRLPEKMRQLHAAGDTEEAAKKYSLILPSLCRLEKIHAPFADVKAEVDAVAREIRQDIAQQMTSGENVDPGECIHLRVRLGESAGKMKDAFLDSTTARVLHGAEVGGRGIEAAAKAVTYFTGSVLPTIVNSAQSFKKMFPDDRDLFSTWVVRLIDESVTVRARGALTNTIVDDLKAVGDLVQQADSMKRAAVQTVNEIDTSDFLTCLVDEVEAACDGVLSEAHASIFASLERKLAQLVNWVICGKRPLSRLLTDFASEIDPAMDSALVLESTFDGSEQAPNSNAMSIVAEGVVNELGSLMVSPWNTIDCRALLVGATVCTVLEKEPRFRRARPLSLCPHLAREYSVRAAFDIVHPMRDTTYTSTSDISQGGEAAASRLEARLTEIFDVLEGSRLESKASLSTVDRRGSSRRGTIAQDKDLGSLHIGVGTTLELVPPAVARAVISNVYKSWLEFIRDAELEKGADIQVQADCGKFRSVILSPFPESSKTLHEEEQRIVEMAKQRQHI